MELLKEECFTVHKFYQSEKMRLLRVLMRMQTVKIIMYFYILMRKIWKKECFTNLPVGRRTRER